MAKRLNKRKAKGSKNSQTKLLSLGGFVIGIEFRLNPPILFIGILILKGFIAVKGDECMENVDAKLSTLFEAQTSRVGEMSEQDATAVFESGFQKRAAFLGQPYFHRIIRMVQTEYKGKKVWNALACESWQKYTIQNGTAVKEIRKAVDTFIYYKGTAKRLHKKAEEVMPLLTAQDKAQVAKDLGL